MMELHVLRALHSYAKSDKTELARAAGFSVFKGLYI